MAWGTVLFAAGTYLAILAFYWGLGKWQEQILQRERDDARGFEVEARRPPDSSAEARPEVARVRGKGFPTDSPPVSPPWNQ